MSLVGRVFSEFIYVGKDVVQPGLVFSNLLDCYTNKESVTYLWDK